jgi:hypothetical protein
MLQRIVRRSNDSVLLVSFYAEEHIFPLIASIGIWIACIVMGTLFIPSDLVEVYAGVVSATNQAWSSCYVDGDGAVPAATDTYDHREKFWIS